MSSEMQATIAMADAVLVPLDHGSDLALHLGPVVLVMLDQAIKQANIAVRRERFHVKFYTQKKRLDQAKVALAQAEQALAITTEARNRLAAVLERRAPKGPEGEGAECVARWVKGLKTAMGLEP
jgi:multidrug resistance efflux pump